MWSILCRQPSSALAASKPTAAAAVDRAIQAFGRIDILHNNVGTTVMGGPVELSEEAWNRSLDINLGSVYRTSRAVLPHMLEHVVRSVSSGQMDMSTRDHSPRLDCAKMQSFDKGSSMTAILIKRHRETLAPGRQLKNGLSD